MLTEITHVNAHHRADGGPKAFDVNNAVHQLEYFPVADAYLLTVTDKANPEFRLRTTFTQDDLLKAKEGPTPEKPHGSQNV